MSEYSFSAGQVGCCSCGHWNCRWCGNGIPNYYEMPPGYYPCIRRRCYYDYYQIHPTTINDIELPKEKPPTRPADVAQTAKEAKADLIKRFEDILSVFLEKLKKED